jgi:MHS family proline/betaine transporter-like MFS transporter
MTTVEALRSEPTLIPSTLVAGAIGNVLEWYDFAAYGYFASVFGRNFFPSTSHLVSLLSAFGVFALAFMMRPIGSIIFGHIGDRYGRKRALMVSVSAMALSTFVIGLLPTYAQIGSLAPLILILLRMVQGASVGGEYTTSIIFLVEQSAPNQRGYVGSWAYFSAIAGILLGSVAGVIVTRLLDPAEVLAWGWRLPFLPGIALGAVAYVMRRRLLEEDYTRIHFARLPLVEAIQTSWRDIVRGFVIVIAFGVAFYLIFVYLATYFQQIDKISATRALTINSISMLFLLIITPIAGKLADRFGRRTIMAAGVAGFIVLSWPLFLLLDRPEFTAILLGQCGLAVLIAAYGGALPAALVEMYPRRIRCSALSFTYNASMGLAGGTAPMVAVYLMGATHSPISPAIYLMVASAISLIGILSMTDRTGKPLL